MEQEALDWQAESAKIRQEKGAGASEPPQPYVARRTLDRSLWYEGQLMVFYANGDEVDNTCCVWEGNIPEGMGPPPHLHVFEHEIFYILEGHINAWVEGVRFDVPKDSLIFMPAGRAHWFVSVAPVTRMLSMTITAIRDMPAKHLQKKLFDYMGGPAQAMTLPDMVKANFQPDPNALAEIAMEQGSHIFHVDEKGWRRAFGERGEVARHEPE